MKVKCPCRFSAVALSAAILALAPGIAACAADSPAAAAQTTPAPPATPYAKLVAVRVGVSPDATTLNLEITGEFTYFSSPSGERLVFVDLPRVVSVQPTESHLLESRLISSYRVVPYLRGGEPGARLELLLKQPATTTFQQTPGILQVKVASAARSAGPQPAAPAPAARDTARNPATPLLAHGTVVEKVTFSRDSDTTRVRVLSNGPVEYRDFQLASPARLVLDIPRTQSRAGNHEIPVELPPVKSIRVGQFSRAPLVSRVVMNLERPAPYKVSAKPDGLEVELKAPPAVGPARPMVPPKSEAVVAAAPPAPRPAEAAAAPADSSTGMKPQAEVAAAVPPPTPPVAAAPKPEAAAPRADMPPLAPMNVAAATQAAQQPAAPPAPAPVAAQAPPAPAGPRYTGEPISVNLKDVDLKDFFRLVHEISGLNIVLDPNVSGRVTIVLEDVPWDQALDIVLRNNSLDKQLEGNVLRIARRDTLRKEEEERLALETAKQAAAERVTVMRPLNYARAALMLATLGKFRSPKGEIIADDRTNTLIITDIPQVIPTIDDIIKQLDRRSVQVEIEARVVAASRFFSRELGAQLGFGAALSGRTIVTGNPVGANTSPFAFKVTQEVVVPKVDSTGKVTFETKEVNVAPFDIAGDRLPLFSNFPAAGANVGFGLFHRSPNAAIDAIISMAETKGIGKLLSRPRIITQNNIQATVAQGVRIPVQTTVNNTISVSFTDVTLRLTVRPQVTNEGTIFLEVSVENTTIDPGIARINGIPALDTQSAQTSVLVNDGGTVVFGGVLQNSNNLTVQQVPLLGSIPVIGHLFKRTGVNTTTNELLFFVTPKIV